MEIPVGLKSTQNYISTADSQSPKRKPKEPVPTKRERADRRQQAKVRLEEIDHERISLNEKLKTIHPKRQEMLRNLRDERKRQKQQVDEMLEEHILQDSSGKLLDRVLQRQLKTPGLSHLEGNIQKIDDTIDFCRNKLKSLSNEQGALEKELRKLDTADVSYSVYDQLQKLFDTYEVCKHEYEKLRELAAEAEKLDREWFSRVPAPSQFHAAVASSYLSRSLGKSSLSAFISHVSGMGAVYASQNPWHLEYDQRDTGADKHIELRRPNFGDSRSVVR
jgi:hypothetical protein